MDKNSALRNSLLFFTDEAIGFRKSLHHFHRWLETQDQDDLEQLIIEIGRENFVDLWPILNCIKKDQVREGIMLLADMTTAGLYLPKKWTTGNEVRLTSLKVYPFSMPMRDMYYFSQSTWQFRDWILENEKIYSGTVDPLNVILYSQQLLADAKTNFLKVFELLEMFFGYNTLASCVLDNDIALFGKVVGSYYKKQHRHIEVLAAVLKNYPDLNWGDALSRNQVRSKVWLLENIKDLKVYKTKRKAGVPAPTTIIVGGWVGLLPFLANMLNIKLSAVINVDIDSTVHAAATELNFTFDTAYRNSEMDIRKLKLSNYANPVVIDTIVEHFADHSEWIKTIPSGVTIVLQGNDMFDVPDHVNCHASYEEFVKSTGLGTTTWSSELNLDKCTRYMAIGQN